MSARERSVRGGVRVFAAAVLLALSACGDSGGGLEPLAAGGVILAFGDSITYGTGAREGESYPEVLAERIGRTVIKAGVPGEVTREGLRRLPGVLSEVRPALVVLCHGGNDILRKLSPHAAAANLGKMIALIRESGAQVVLLGVPRFGLLLDTADFYHQVAEAQGVPLEADVIPDVLSDNGLKSDTVHPNAAGYARIAQAVEELLHDQGAL